MRIRLPVDIYEVVEFVVDFILPLVILFIIAFALWSLYLLLFFQGFH